jgi:hypothetical protein
MAGPMAGESLEQYRARRKAEMAGQPAPEAGFEAAKAKVAEKQKAKEVALAPAKKGIDLDRAAQDADELNATHKKLAGGVKALDMDAIKAADKDKEWRGKSEEEQVAVAKSKPAKPAGVAHSTSTPGSAPQTSMGAALSKAGMTSEQMQDKIHHDSSQDTASTGKVDAGLPGTVNKKLDAATIARNNGGGRGTSGGDVAAAASAVAGRTISPSEAAAARGRSDQGTRKNGGIRERTPGGRIQKPVAPAAAPQAATPSQGVFGTQLHARAFAAAVGQNGPSSQLSAKPVARPVAVQAPVSNPAPIAPAPASKPTPAAPSAPTTQPPVAPASEAQKPQQRYGRFDKDTGQGTLFGTSGMRKGNRVGDRMGELPEHDYTAAPGRNQPSMITDKGRISVNAKAPDGGQKPRSAPQKPAVLKDDGAQRIETTGAAAHVSQQQMAQASPTPVAEHVDTVPGPASVAEAPRRLGRSTESPRGEMGGGHMARPGGGLHVTGDNNSNIGNVTHNYNYIVHGDNYGHVGNAEGGRSSGPGNAGRNGNPRIAGGRAPRESEGAKPDIWVKDVNGTHSLREGVEHVTGQTGGRGEKLSKGKATAGGSQRPIAGTPRSSAGGVQMAAPSATPGTGTTHNWQGPAGGVNMPKSGIGSSGYTATKPNPKLVEES